MRRTLVLLLLCACASPPRPMPTGVRWMKGVHVALEEVKPEQRDFRVQFMEDIEAAGAVPGPGGLSVRANIVREDHLIATVTSAGGDEELDIDNPDCVSTAGDQLTRVPQNVRCLAREFAIRIVESAKV